MLKLTAKQIKELLDIIKYHHTVFLVTHVGTDFLSKEDKAILKRFGIDVDKIENIDSIGIAYKFGILSEALTQNQGNNISYTDFKRYIKSGRFIPLNTREKESLAYIKRQTTNDIRGLSDKISANIGDKILSEERRLKTIQAITEEEQRGIEERRSINQIVSDIQERTGDYSRDFDRIISYRSQDAFESGRSEGIKRNYAENVDPTVFKIPFNQACKHCIRVFLESGVGSKPIIFKLSELQANGTNIGRKANDYQATIGPIHPYCRCLLRYVDLNTHEWSAEDQDFVYKKNIDLKVKNLPKPKVIITED